MDLLVRQIITHLLKLYDAQRNLVIIVNASQSDEDGLGEDLSNLGVRKPGLRQVGYEMNAKQRYIIIGTGVCYARHVIHILSFAQEATVRIRRFDLGDEPNLGRRHA